MKVPQLLAAALTCATAHAQFDVDRSLIPPGDSRPVQGIPLDGLWAHQDYVGQGALPFADELGYLGTHTIDRVRWDEEKGEYAGVVGWTSRRILPLGDGRFLLERDRDPNGERIFMSNEVYFGGKVLCTLVAWRDGGLCDFGIDTEPGSPFTRHMQGAGLRVEDGIVQGERDAILRALRTLPLDGFYVESRMRRPNAEEMAEVWSVFELERWAKTQTRHLRDIEKNLSRLQSLPNLHLASFVLRNAANHRVAELAPLTLDEHEYCNWWPQRYKDLYTKARQLQEVVSERLDRRMEWLSEQVEVLEYTKAEDPDEFPWHPHAGRGVRFHVVVRAEDGRLLEDTRAKDMPVDARLSGDLSEGLQYALRTTAFGDVQRVRIPSHLAFGEQFGDVEVEVEPLESLPDSIDEPPLGIGLGGYRIEPLEAESTPSGLRYRVLAEGMPGSATPPAGRKVTVRLSAWTAWGAVLDDDVERVFDLADPDVLPGVREALVSMTVGEHRVLFVPSHLADRRPERAGLAQCISIRLHAIQGLPVQPPK